MIDELTIRTSSQGLLEITSDIRNIVRAKNVMNGLCSLFIKHTSASLLIQENADPSARKDLESWLNRLVPEDDPLYTHLAEGSDDMPAHIKSMLTASSLSIPIMNEDLALGIWQGIFLFEHRHGNNDRTVVIHIAVG